MGFLNRNFHRVLMIGGILGLLAIAGGIFALRSPILVVTDVSFTRLYGNFRTVKKQVELSLRFFRPVKSVMIAENAGADMVVFAVEEIAKSPYAVLFPYRYYEGARRYVEKFPGTPSLVMGGRVPTGSVQRGTAAEGAAFIGTDARGDYYRAGLAAVFFVRKKPGKLLFFQDERVSAADREAFSSGLREGGWMEPPLFLDSTIDYTQWQDVSCAVMNVQAAAFFDRNLKIPVILFSWLDPALTPAAVKVIFDDSPWALAVRAIENLGRGGGEGPVASDMIIFPERIGDPEIIRSLQKTVDKTL